MIVSEKWKHGLIVGAFAFTIAAAIAGWTRKVEPVPVPQPASEVNRFATTTKNVAYERGLGPCAVHDNAALPAFAIVHYVRSTCEPAVQQYTGVQVLLNRPGHSRRSKGKSIVIAAGGASVSAVDAGFGGFVYDRITHH